MRRVSVTEATDECIYLMLEEDTPKDEETGNADNDNDDDSDDNEGRLVMPLFGAFKSHSFIIGLLVGFFVQFSTLGANFLVIALWENDLMSKSKTEIVTLSLVWSAFTSLMAILTLGFLRSVVTIVFRASMPSASSAASQARTEAILDEVVLHLECRFVVGALVGVCLAWTATDLLLGMNIQIMFSLATLTISLLWCKLMMHCFTKDEKSLIHESKREKKREPVIVLV